MIVRIDGETKKRFDRLSRAEGKNSSQVLREIVAAYISEHDTEGYIEDLWGRIGEILSAKNPKGVHNIDRVIGDFRKQPAARR